jgi:hypothetical protein
VLAVHRILTTFVAIVVNALEKEVDMRVVSARSLAALAIVAVIGVGVPAVASAKGTTTTTTTIRAVSPRKAYDKALIGYRDDRTAIGLSYQGAVNAAQSVYLASLAVARNSAQRSTARATLRLVITEATAAREAALLSLGKPPVKP